MAGRPELAERAAGLTLSSGDLATADIIFSDYNQQDGLNGEALAPSEWMNQAMAGSVMNAPYRIVINANQQYLDSMTPQGVSDADVDFARTYVLTHELGHALGLKHTDECGRNDASIMRSGYYGQFSQGFNSPQEFDIVNIRELYGLPT